MTFLPDFGISSLAYVGIFLGVLLIYSALWQLLSRSESLGEARNRRMKMIASGATTEDLLRVLKPASGGWALSGLPFLGNLPSDLRRAGLTISAQLFLTIALAAFAVVTMAASTIVLAPIGVAFGHGPAGPRRR